eukprot:403362189
MSLLRIVGFLDKFDEQEFKSFFIDFRDTLDFNVPDLVRGLEVLNILSYSVPIFKVLQRLELKEEFFKLFLKVLFNFQVQYNLETFLLSKIVLQMNCTMFIVKFITVTRRIIISRAHPSLYLKSGS